MLLEIEINPQEKWLNLLDVICKQVELYDEL